VGIASIGSSLLAAAALATGGAEAQTTAPNNPPKVTVKAPKGSIKTGTHYDISSSGYSGGFNRVAIFVSVGVHCSSTALAEAKTGTPEYLFKVPAQQKFAVATKDAYRAKAPGDRYACAYLFLHKHADSGDQLVAEKHFRVKAKH
jgi:hypothetical protein